MPADTTRPRAAEPASQAGIRHRSRQQALCGPTADAHPAAGCSQVRGHRGGASRWEPRRGGAFLVAELFKLGREPLDRDVCAGGSAMGERSSGAKDALLTGIP